MRTSNHYSMHWNGSLDPDESSFVPILELRPENTYLFLFFLTSNEIMFLRPTIDSWFGPTTNTTDVRKFKFSKWGNTSTTTYRQNEPGSPLGCRELEQFCIVGV